WRAMSGPTAQEAPDRRIRTNIARGDPVALAVEPVAPTILDLGTPPARGQRFWCPKRPGEFHACAAVPDVANPGDHIPPQRHHNPVMAATCSWTRRRHGIERAGRQFCKGGVKLAGCTTRGGKA